MDGRTLSLGLVCTGEEVMNNWQNSDGELGEEPKSKSQIKREFKALQDLGKQLVDVPAKQLVALPLSDNMRGLVATAKNLKHGTLNRQLRLIGSCMPEEDVDAILTALEKLKRPHKQAVGQLHEREQWRDRLLQGDAGLFKMLAEKFAGFEYQYVNQLIRNAKKEQEQNKAPKSARLLFQYLKELQESK